MGVEVGSHSLAFRNDRKTAQNNNARLGGQQVKSLERTTTSRKTKKDNKFRLDSKFCSVSALSLNAMIDFRNFKRVFRSFVSFVRVFSVSARFSVSAF